MAPFAGMQTLLPPAGAGLGVQPAFAAANDLMVNTSAVEHLANEAIMSTLMDMGMGDDAVPLGGSAPPWPSAGITVGYVILFVAYFAAAFTFVFCMTAGRRAAGGGPATPPEKGEEVASAKAVGDHKEVTISVEGMHCSACSGAVESALLEIPGVLQASVSLVSKSAKIAFDERTTTAKLVDAVSDMGFPSRTMHGSEVSRSAFHSDQDEAWAGLRLFFGSLVFTGPVLIIMLLMFIPGPCAKLDSYVVPGLSLYNLLVWLLATPVQFGFGLRFYRSTFLAFRNCKTNMDVLVALGSSAAYFSGVILVIISMVTRSCVRRI